MPFCRLVGKLPNTYAYSKNLTEQLVSSYSSKFPTVIARPSIGKTANSSRHRHRHRRHHHHLERKTRVLSKRDLLSSLTPRWFWGSFITAEYKTLWSCFLYKYQITQNQKLLFTYFISNSMAVNKSRTLYVCPYFILLTWAKFLKIDCFWRNSIQMDLKFIVSICTNN
jgi:hypothetical protein